LQNKVRGEIFLQTHMIQIKGFAYLSKHTAQQVFWMIIDKI